MVIISTITRLLAASPLLYLYIALAAGEAVTNHLNSGLSGSRLLGAANIALTLLMFVPFYLQLNRMRSPLNFPGPRSTIGLFLSVYGFRLRLLVVILPALYLLYATNAFNEFTQAYFGMRTGLSTAKDVWKIAWPWLLMYFGILALDQAGRSYVVAFGKARGSFVGALRAIPALAIPLGIFMALEIALFFLSMADFLMGPDAPAVWTPATKIALSAPYFLLEIGGSAYMADRLRKRAELQPS